MDIFIYVSLLVAALCHAGWNVVLKSADDKIHSMALIGGFTSLVSLCFLPFTSILPFEIYIFMFVSFAVHFVYKLCLIEAYKIGDFAQIYPIARGTAPLVILVMAFIFLGETVSFLSLGFIVILVFGVCLASYSGDNIRLEKKAIGFALATAFFIACYSVIDGIAVRYSGDVFSYVIWLMFFDGVIFFLFSYYRCGSSIISPLVRQWRSGVIGGVLILLAYGIALWAMTKVSLALVASIRETSILFAIFLAWFCVKERISKYQILSVLLILVGVIGIKFA